MDSFPYVSIIIPTFNEATYIKKLLTQISSQKYPTNKTEIIIVDNNSKDQTIGVVKKQMVRSAQCLFS